MSEPISDVRPLAGRRVLITRPRAQADDLVGLLEAAGALAIVAPTIRIAPPGDPEPLRHAARHAAQFHWIVFASANGVDAFLDAVAAVPAAERQEGEDGLPQIAAVGRRTADRLRERGVAVTIVPNEFTAEALVAALTSSAALGGARVLLPRSEIGRDVIAGGLRAAGADVTEVVAYRTITETSGDVGHDVRRLLADGQMDAVTFTSGSSVRNFVQLHGEDSSALLQRSVVAVIGPVTADAARALGVRVDVQPHSYTTASMVEALAAYFARAS